MSPSASVSASASASRISFTFPAAKILLPLLFLLCHLLVGHASAGSRHVIVFSAPGLLPSGLAWDPTAQHFVVGHRHRPAALSVSDAGVVHPLFSDALPTPDSHVAAIAIDDARRRLLASLARPAALAAYDLRSPVPHSRIFLAPLPDPDAVPGGVGVDPSTGAAFVTSTTGGVIYKVDLEGNLSVLSRSSVFAAEAGGVGGGERGWLGGVAHVTGRSFLLAVQGGTGRMFKVDEEDGAARAVTGPDKGLLPPGGRVAAVAVRADGSAVVAVGRSARLVRSNDGWAQAGVQDESEFDKGSVGGVALREGKRVYVLLEEEGNEDGGVLGRDREGISGKDRKFSIEEVEWATEGEGEMVWGMVLIGLGLAYFMYWRFQMGRLFTDLNKKRA